MIQIRSLTYTYPHADKPALQDVTLTIEDGEAIGVIGPNGAGKSTFCYSLMGLVPHFFHGTIKGDIWLDGLNIPDASLPQMAQRVGLVFQDPSNQFSGAKMTVEEEIAFGLENLGVERAEMLNRIDWVIDLFGLEAIRKRDPYQLSGGQMQRVAIASVLAMKPKLLVLDEPTSQLDPVGTKDVFDAVDTLRAQGVSIVIVEHKTELLVEHCSRIAVLKDGALQAFDAPSKLFNIAEADTWGVEIPRYTQVFRQLEPTSDTVPTCLNDTVERLRNR